MQSKRIAIIGSPGSGKSTLALKLHQKLGLPLYHLDQYFWKPGWVRPDRDEFQKIHHALCDKPEWLMEGMATRYFEYRLQRADTIIFLDIPRYKCLYRVLKRAFQNWGNVLFSSAPGCPERGPSLEFLKYIWHFPNKQKPEIEALLAQYKDQKTIFVIRSNDALKQLLHKM